MTSKDKEVQAKKDQLPANISFEDDAGQGFENTDIDSFAVPFLVIAQSNSPQVDPDQAEFIEGLKQGMLFNTVTGDIYEARKKDGNGVLVVPCAYQRQFIEWAPRGTGSGGLVEIHDVEEGLALSKTLVENKEGRRVLPNGNTLADTRMHYVLMQHTDGSWIPVIISMSSTQVKKSRRWMTVMDNIKFTRQDGSKFTPAMYSHTYKVSSVPESNEKGNWHGFDITKHDIVSSSELYDQAKKFKDKVAAGAVEVAQPVNEDDTPDI